MTTTPKPLRKGAVPLADLPPTTADDASAESQADRLFADEPAPPPHPHVVLQTTIRGLYVRCDVQ